MKTKKIKEIKEPKEFKESVKVKIAKYIGSKEIYFPSFKKIVNRGDLVPEMPLDEAKGRRDFIVIDK